MLAVWVASVTCSVAPELLPLKVGVCIVAKLTSRRSKVSAAVSPANEAFEVLGVVELACRSRPAQKSLIRSMPLRTRTVMCR